MSTVAAFDEIRAAAHSELSRIIEFYERGAEQNKSEGTITFPSDGNNFRYPTISREEVIADSLKLILSNDVKVSARFEDVDMSKPIQPSVEAQLLYNIVSSTNNLMVIGVTGQKFFEIQPVAHEDGDQPPKEKPKLLLLFLKSFFKNIRQEICPAKKEEDGEKNDRSAVKTGILAGISGLIGAHLGIDPQLAAGIAAAIILIVVRSGQDTFCGMTDEELLMLLGFRV